MKRLFTIAAALLILPAAALASDGKFYPCPAFYYAGCGFSGDVETGIDLANPQLYRLDHAPLCRRCDAYQCRRCIWLNRKYTNEICVPSHGQCIAAHVERNASRRLLAMMKDAGVDMSTPRPVEDALAVFEQYVTALEEIMEREA